MNRLNRAGAWRHFVFFWVNFSLATPTVYLLLGLPLVMRQYGWSGLEIGAFQMAGLPAVFKLLLAVPVQRWQLGKRPDVYWACLFGLAYIGALLFLARVGVGAPKSILFVSVCCATLMAAWSDIPVNALAIRLLPPNERQRAGGLRSAATFCGAIVGAGVMLLLQQSAGWAAPLLLLSVIVFSALLALLCLPDTQDAARVDVKSSQLNLAGFFRQANIGRWTILLLAYFPFVAAAWVFLKPLLHDHGLAQGNIAWVAGIGGGLVGALVSLLASSVARRHLTFLLPVSAFANALVLALLALTVTFSLSSTMLIVSSLLLAAAMGLTSTIAFALMMDFARREHRAIDYGGQTTIFTLGRIAVLPLAGWVLDLYGYAALLTGLSIVAFTLAITVNWQRFALAHLNEDKGSSGNK